MPSIFSVTVPFFALVALGYLAAWRRLLPELAVPGLNAYVLYFALPCLLFRFGASMPFAELLDPALVAVYAVGALLMVAVTLRLTVARGGGPPGAGPAAAGRPRNAGTGAGVGAGVDLRNAAFGALLAAFPNTGFMGVPLLVALYGPQAAGPVIGTLLVDLFLTSTLCLAVAELHRHRAGAGAGADADADADADLDAADRAAAWRTVWRSLAGAGRNPLPWAIALGAGLAASRLALPAPAAQLVRMLADSASPVALFTIGAVLRRAGQQAHQRTPLRRCLPVALLKLILHPALVGAIGLVGRACGLPVPVFGLTVLVLAAALPSASNVSLLAERYGADNGRVASIILASTVLAFASFSLLAGALSPLRSNG